MAAAGLVAGQSRRYFRQSLRRSRRLLPRHLRIVAKALMLSRNTARFRADLSLLAELNEIEGENDFFPLGTVPREWCDERLIGSAHAEGNYADTYGAAWIAYLRHRLAGECLRLGLNDVDASLLQRSAPGRLTQLASLEARREGLDGIYYRSRHGHDLENWALFEPFRISRTTSQAIAADDQTLMEALRILELKLV